MCIFEFILVNRSDCLKEWTAAITQFSEADFNNESLGFKGEAIDSLINKTVSMF